MSMDAFMGDRSHFIDGWTKIFTKGDQCLSTPADGPVGESDKRQIELATLMHTCMHMMNINM